MNGHIEKAVILIQVTSYKYYHTLCPIVRRLVKDHCRSLHFLLYNMLAYINIVQLFEVAGQIGEIANLKRSRGPDNVTHVNEG